MFIRLWSHHSCARVVALQLAAVVVAVVDVVIASTSTPNVCSSEETRRRCAERIKDNFRFFYGAHECDHRRRGAHDSRAECLYYGEMAHIYVRVSGVCYDWVLTVAVTAQTFPHFNPSLSNGTHLALNGQRLQTIV